VKVSNSQKPADAHDGVSRETLNNWQREDFSKRSKKDTSHRQADPSKDMDEQAEDDSKP
jgi:hypothetical protein